MPLDAMYMHMEFGSISCARLNAFWEVNWCAWMTMEAFGSLWNNTDKCNLKHWDIHGNFQGSLSFHENICGNIHERFQILSNAVKCFHGCVEMKSNIVRQPPV